MGSKTVIIFLSSTRPERMADRVGSFVKKCVEANGMKAETFDPMTMKFDMLKTPLHFMAKPEDAPAWLREANEKLQKANGFIIVSAEYNSFMPPALINMLDHFPPLSYRHRPVGVITYSVGELGGVRVQTLLPTFTTELGMVTIPTRVTIMTVQNTITKDGKCNDKKLEAKINTLIKEVEWYADAIGNQKLKSPLPS